MSAEPWVRITAGELKALASLRRRDLLVWMAARLLGRNGWAVRRRDLEQQTRLSKRHVLLALTELEASGYLRRQYCGDAKDPWGRMRLVTTVPAAQPNSDPIDHSTVIPGITEDRSPGSPTVIPRIAVHLPDPDRSEISKNRPAPPDKDRARAEPGRGGGGGRDDRISELEQLARQLWPELIEPGKYLERLCAAAGDATLAELQAYLRDAHRTVQARYPLGAACSAQRWAAWRRRRKHLVRTQPREPGDVLTPGELAALAEAATRDLH